MVAGLERAAVDIEQYRALLPIRRGGVYVQIQAVLRTGTLGAPAHNAADGVDRPRLDGAVGVAHANALPQLGIDGRLETQLTHRGLGERNAFISHIAVFRNALRFSVGRFDDIRRVLTNRFFFLQLRSAAGADRHLRGYLLTAFRAKLCTFDLAGLLAQLRQRFKRRRDRFELTLIPGRGDCSAVLV